MTIYNVKVTKWLYIKDFSLVSIGYTLLEQIDTRDEIWGKLFLTIMSAVGEMERSLIKEKQRNGVAIAKSQGKYKGRVKKYHFKHTGMKHALDLYKSGEYTVREITEITSISRSALYRVLKEEEKAKELTETVIGEPYFIHMGVYQPIKPGMNKPEAHQKWQISTKNVSEMDFSDKETLLGEIHLYGNFEGVHPSGMK